MALEDYTRYQQGIIKRYYANQEAISLDKLSELVADLYLAEGKARQKIWKSLVAAMQKLGVATSRIEHLQAKDDPKLLAELVKELSGK